MNKKDDISFEKSRKAFDQFIKKYGRNKDFMDKAVGFYDGNFVAIMNHETDIVEFIYSKFGNVSCYVGKITTKKRVLIIE